MGAQRLLHGLAANAGPATIFGHPARTVAFPHDSFDQKLYEIPKHSLCH